MNVDPAFVQWLEVLVPAVVIAAFGYRQFNSWTVAECRSAMSDTELLAYAPPRSFSPLWRFLVFGGLYCLTLIALYLVLFVLLRNSPASVLELLKVSGVTPENAWLVALFIVTGLTPMLPVFSNVEHTLRKVMHDFAFVPAKAQQMADELASPTTTFDFDDTHLVAVVLPRLAPQFQRSDFSRLRALTIAQKWVRLKLLLMKFAPSNTLGHATSQGGSPYLTRFLKDCSALEREVNAFAAANPELLRVNGGSPAAVALAERIDQLQHRLYELMCCQAFGSARSADEVVRYFRDSYGIGVGHVQLAKIPFDPMIDALVAATATVLVIAIAYHQLHPEVGRVHPFVWAATSFATHGVGLLVGWSVFAQRRVAHRWDGPTSAPISRQLLIASVVLAFALSIIPTFASTIYADYQGTVTDPWLDVAGRALQRSWPWAFLGSATAMATFIHLERSANRMPALRLRAFSAGGQALTNVCISLIILAVHTTMPGMAAPDLLQNLQQPVIQLVLALTGSIGLVLGFFLPSVVHGHGLDRRAGVERLVLPRSDERSKAVFTYAGRQCPAVLETLSLSGALVELHDADADLVPGRHGVLTLHSNLAITVYVVRLLTGVEPLSAQAPHRFAVRFASRHRHVPLAPEIDRRLRGFLGVSDPLPAT